VAYVSYNTYPGKHAPIALREMMQFHIRNFTDPRARATQARALVDFLVQSVPGESNVYGQTLRREQQVLRDKGGGYLLHDELANVNDPVYFHQFMAHATRHGLQFLAEAEISVMMAKGFSPAVGAFLAKLGPDILSLEQYLDFLTNRGFRQTLLCRQEIPLQHEPKPESVGAFLFASRAECVSATPDLASPKPEEFRSPRGVTVGTDHPLSKAAFVHLAAVWPQALSFDALQTAARQRLGGDGLVMQTASDHLRDRNLLAENLLQAFLAEVIEFHVQVPPMALEPGSRPKAPELARYQASKGPRVTNLRHEVIPLEDLTGFLLRHLDGTRDHPDLVNLLTTYVKDRGLVVQRQGQPITEPAEISRALAEGLETQLRLLARSALLVG
jgi:methyltransferase-like protein